MEIKPTGKVDAFFIKAKKFADAVPIFSTLTNTVNLLQKYFIVAHLSDETLENHHYFKEIKQETYGDLALKTIPFYSTVLYVIDLKKKGDYKQSLIETFSRIPQNLYDLDNPDLFDPQLSEKDKKDICLAVVQKKGSALEFMPERFKNDRKIVQAAYENDKNSFKFAGEKAVFYFVDKLNNSDEYYHLEFELKEMLRYMSSSVFESLLLDPRYKGKLLKNITPREKLPSLSKMFIEEFERAGQLEKLFQVYFNQQALPNGGRSFVDLKTAQLLLDKFFENPKKINVYLNSSPNAIEQICELWRQKRKLKVSTEILKSMLMNYTKGFRKDIVEKYLKDVKPNERSLEIKNLKDSITIENIKFFLFYRKDLSKEDQIELWNLVVDALKSDRKLNEAAHKNGIHDILSIMTLEDNLFEIGSKFDNLLRLNLINEQFIDFLSGRMAAFDDYFVDYQKNFGKSVVSKTAEYLILHPYRATQLDIKTPRFNQFIRAILKRHLTENQQREIWKLCVKEKPELYEFIPEKFKEDETIKDTQNFLYDELTRLKSTKEHLEYLEKTALLTKGQKTYLFSKLLDIDSKTFDKIPEEFRAEAQKMHEDRASLELLTEEVKKKRSLLNYIDPKTKIPSETTEEEENLIAKLRDLDRFSKLKLCLNAVKSDPGSLGFIPENFRTTWHPEITTAARAIKSS